MLENTVLMTVDVGMRQEGSGLTQSKYLWRYNKNWSELMAQDGGRFDLQETMTLSLTISSLEYISIC